MDSDTDVDIDNFELDTSWIEELENEDIPYDKFYKESVDYFNIFYVYINNNKNIYNIKKQVIDISNNVFKKEELVASLRKYRINNNIKHSLISVLQYNIDINPDEIKFFLSKKNPDINFLSVKKDLNDIKWNDTIQYFKKINSLYVLFYQEREKTGKQTKKIFIKNIKLKKNKHTRKRV